MLSNISSAAEEIYLDSAHTEWLSVQLPPKREWIERIRKIPRQSATTLSPIASVEKPFRLGFYSAIKRYA